MRFSLILNLLPVLVEPGVFNYSKNMAYKFELPKAMLKDLWILREYCAKGPIIQQVRKAVSLYIQKQERKIGCPLKDIVEVMERHEKEKRANQDWRLKLENQIEDRNRRLSKKLY